ncbi:ParB/RepB/Spo0J family partition protein [Patescibacteria group bacterium]
MPKQVLGRGLEALIPTKNISSTTAADKVAGLVTHVQLKNIIPNPHQPRHHFAKEELADLAASIKKHGVLQPIVVTQLGSKYELIAGERRAKAAKLAGLKEIPAVVKEATEQDKLELAIIENVQRHNLNPIEEARAYRKLIDEFKLTQEGVGMQVGRSREVVANTMRFLDLPEEIQEALVKGKISIGHAKALRGIKSSDAQRKLFLEIVSNGVTVRETEKRARQPKPIAANKKTDPYLKDLEEKLREILGAKVSVRRTKDGIRLMVDCYSEDEVRDLAAKISNS